MPTYEMRKRGYNVTAKPVPEENYHYEENKRINDDYLSHNPFKVWGKPQLNYILQDYENVYDKIIENLNDSGEKEAIIKLYYPNKTLDIFDFYLIDSAWFYNGQKDAIHIKTKIKKDKPH